MINQKMKERFLKIAVLIYVGLAIACIYCLMLLLYFLGKLSFIAIIILYFVPAGVGLILFMLAWFLHTEIANYNEKSANRSNPPKENNPLPKRLFNHGVNVWNRNVVHCDKLINLLSCAKHSSYIKNKQNNADKHSLHPLTLTQGKEGEQPNANKTLSTASFNGAFPHVIILDYTFMNREVV
jgi:hypothetical protein